MPKIKNKEYLKFLETGLINILTKEEYQKIKRMAGENHHNSIQAKTLVTLLYYTGRRPSEILELQSDNFERDRRYLNVKMQTKKRGRGSYIYLPMNEDIKEVWEYVKNLPPKFYIIWEFKGSSIKKVNGKEYEVTSYKIEYWIKKWSKLAGKKLTPYFFRHNRLSELALKGADMNELMHFKGSKDVSSVIPYLHMSPKKIKKLARLMQ
ncbi:MAG: site-specific integrase [Cellulophaga sp.]